jgi:uncharacterized protein YycO
MFASLIPAEASAHSALSGWEELERYTGKEMKADSDAIRSFIRELELAKEQYGRELTPEETITWKKCIDAQIIYEKTWNTGTEPSKKDLTIMSAAGEAVFGTPEEILALAEKGYDRKYPGPDEPQLPEPQPITEDGKLVRQQLDLEPNSNSGVVSQKANAQDPSASGIKDLTKTNEEEQLLSPSSFESWYLGGTYSTPIGIYPREKGKILVTNDWAFGLIPTGHAAIVYNGLAGNEWGIIESLSGGVTHNPNDWNDRTSLRFHPTCFALDVVATNGTQEAAVAEWCAAKVGLPYNWLFGTVSRTDAYYCSQLVWQGYYNLSGIDLNTSDYGWTVHPLELVHSSKTAMTYRHGSALSNRWSEVNGKWYFIDSDGFPLKGGWRWTDSANGWRYFAPTGVLVASLQVSPGSTLNTSKRMDMGWSKVPGAQMQIWSRTGGDNERWDLFSIDGLSWYIQSRYSEMYLAIPNGTIYNEAPIIQWVYTGGSEQKWRLVQSADGSYQFRSALNSNYVIDVKQGSTANGTKLQLYQSNNTPAQKWRLMETW